MYMQTVVYNAESFVTLSMWYMRCNNVQISDRNKWIYWWCHLQNWILTKCAFIHTCSCT